MHVRVDLRGTGIGGLLLEAAVDVARAAGCYRVQLTSNTARSDAHRFNEHHGIAGEPRRVQAPARTAELTLSHLNRVGSACGEERIEQTGPVVGCRSPRLG
jgi:predicted N-acetyltransferase YhbS